MPKTVESELTRHKRSQYIPRCMEAIIEARGLVKNYGNVQAVAGIDLAVPEGICFGLLGPNGAGKTTTIEVLEGILEPTSGEIRFQGGPREPAFRERIGIQFQSTALQEHLTVMDTLQLFSSLYSRKRNLEEVIEICSLGELLKRDNRKLSGGQRQRLLLALAIVNDPDLVFLDEPTTGLDPQARRNFWALVERIKAEKKTVLLTTHYMEEAEELCEEIAIMDHGVIIAQGSPRNLLDQNFAEAVITLPCSSVPESKAHLVDALASEFPNVSIGPDTIEVITDNMEESVRRLLELGLSLDGLSVHKPNLDDLFLSLTGSSLRQ